MIKFVRIVERKVEGFVSLDGFKAPTKGSSEHDSTKNKNKLKARLKRQRIKQQRKRAR